MKIPEKEQSYPYKKSSSSNPVEIAIESKDLDRVSFTELYPIPSSSRPSPRAPPPAIPLHGRDSD